MTHVQWKNYTPDPEKLKTVPPLTTNNVVSTYCLRSGFIRLAEVAQSAPCMSFNSLKFAAGTMRLKYPQTTSLVFDDGRGVCTGAKSKEQSRLACRKFAAVIQSVGYNVTFSDFHVQNIVSSVHCSFKIALNSLEKAYQTYASYRPDKFPGLKFRITRSEHLSESDDEDDEDVLEAKRRVSQILKRRQQQGTSEQEEEEVVVEEEEEEEEEDDDENAMLENDHDLILANYAKYRRDLDSSARSSMRGYDEKGKGTTEHSGGSVRGNNNCSSNRRGKIAFIVFHSGNCIVTGAKTKSQAMKAWTWFYLEVLCKFVYTAAHSANAAQYRLRETRLRSGASSMSAHMRSSVCSGNLENDLLISNSIIAILLEERKLRASRAASDSNDDAHTVLSAHAPHTSLSPLHDWDDQQETLSATATTTSSPSNKRKLDGQWEWNLGNQLFQQALNGQKNKRICIF